MGEEEEAREEDSRLAGGVVFGIWEGWDAYIDDGDADGGAAAWAEGGGAAEEPCWKKVTPARDSGTSGVREIERERERVRE